MIDIFLYSHTYLPDIVSMLLGEILSWLPGGVKG